MGNNFQKAKTNPGKSGGVMSIYRKHIRCSPWIGLLAVLICFALVRPAKALQNAENQDVRSLLSLASDQASILDYDADQMTGLLHSDVDWQLHAAMLNKVREHVNDLGKTITKLEAERSHANRLQQQAIDRAIPLMRELAANTTDAIEHLNKNQIRPVSGDYPEYLDANANTAHELARLIDATAEYGHTRNKLEKLQQEIEVASR
jgi:hypothetical protein